MTLCVLGLGYVGTVVAAMLAGRGRAVVGVDIDPVKVALLAEGRPSFAEPGLAEALDRARPRLRASDDPAAALRDARLVLVCVGTPTGADGRPDLRAVDRVAEQLGAALRDPQSSLRTIVLRSTVPPGTTRGRFIPAIEALAGRPHGEGWHVLFCPEFLREGNALDDVAHPPQTVVGAEDPAHAAPYLEALGDATGPVRHASFETAELLKLAANAYHAVKVDFANEVGALARAAGTDGREVMELLCHDTTLNVSAAYLRPGGPFGGSCLPKDLRALGHLAADHRLDLPLLEAVLPANAAQLRRLVDAVVSTGARRVGVVGLAFKPGTDDLRHSPMLELVRVLRLDQRTVWIHDPRIDPSLLRGRNLRFAELGLPGLPELLLDDLSALAERSDALVLARRVDPSLAPRLRGRALVDLAGNDALRSLPGYRTVAW